jgi:predicted Rossmann fold flavoprotein
MPKRFDVAVIGGGAAGLVAAISAARRGGSVVICERMPRLGKKILVTGGGRCNLTNDELGPEAFTSGSPGLVAAVFGRFGKEDIRRFFKDLGLETYSEGGRVFPATNQASSVLKVLELEIGRLGVAVELGFEATGIGHSGPSFSIEAGDGRRVEARSVVLAGGGRSYPALGSNGSAYALAVRFGHRLVTPVPSAVPVLAKDRMCHFLQGQKVRAAAVALIGEKPACRAEGEVLFTQYGLSGTAVLDVSESLSIAIHRDGRADSALVLDLVPFMSAEALAAEVRRRAKAGWPAGDLAAGILPDKFAPVISAMAAGAERGTGGARRRSGDPGMERGRIHERRRGRARGRSADPRIQAPTGAFPGRGNAGRPGRTGRLQPGLGLGFRPCRRHRRGPGQALPEASRSESLVKLFEDGLSVDPHVGQPRRQG